MGWNNIDIKEFEFSGEDFETEFNNKTCLFENIKKKFKINFENSCKVYYDTNSNNIRYIDDISDISYISDMSSVCDMCDMSVSNYITTKIVRN